MSRVPEPEGIGDVGTTRRGLGALPFAEFAWWSFAVPVSGLLIVALGMVWISGTATRGAEA
jgi:hypothetical protein